MNKTNIARSSEFHMSEGDILHYILIVDSGATPTIGLTSIVASDNQNEPPDAVVALDASDITDSSFTANWYFIENATGYYIDVATDSEFTSFVAGYEDLSVGYVNEYPIVGLTDAYTYYYRVRAINDDGTGDSSNTITTTTDVAEVVDGDGNVYTYVTIGTQQWLVENLRTTKYADGTPIPNMAESEYDDWFLASNDEFTLVYTNLYLHGVGGLLPTFYWTSSEVNATQATRFNITTGVTSNENKIASINYRPIRSFVSSSIYNLRDAGPAGGLIFHIIDNGDSTYTYYELSLTVFGTTVWSNITGLAVGTTGTAVGTGQTNTTAIIGQAGHTNSAAKLCDDLSEGGWVNDTDGAYCYYDNDEATYKDDYGALYNWYAATNAHGIAPTGWRVATKADWTNLETFLTATPAKDLKEEGLTHWNTPNTGTDEYGFAARGAGRRNTFGLFLNILDSFYCWTSTAKDVTNGEDSIITHDSDNINQSYALNKYGFSVRCMRDI